MKNWIKTIGLAASVLLPIGCKEQIQDLSEAVQDDDSYSVDMALESMNKASDDFSEEVENKDTISSDVPTDNLTEGDFDTEIDREKEDSFDPRYLLCRRPAKRRTCRTHGEESTKMAIYRHCLMPKRRLFASGIVRLDYNNENCDLSQSEQLVQRNYNLTLNRIHGGKAHISSREKKNYLGDSFGGGEVLERTDTGWEISILGRHIDARNRRNHKRASISIETDKPLVIEGSLKRRARKVVSGTTLVHHNLAKFTVSYSPDNLIWTNDCECPVSGTMNVVYTGSKTGKGQVTFNGCGQVDLEKPDRIRKKLKLNQCFKIENDSSDTPETDESNDDNE